MGLTFKCSPPAPFVIQIHVQEDEEGYAPELLYDATEAQVEAVLKLLSDVGVTPRPVPLTPTQRSMLEYLAGCGRPVSAAVVGRNAGLSCRNGSSQYRKLLRQLKVAGLVENRPSRLWQITEKGRAAVAQDRTS